MDIAEEARRLLDADRYTILLFKDGLGHYCALAIPEGESADQALEDWEAYEWPDGMPPGDTVYDGPNRMCGCGHSVSDALHAVTEKVLLRQLPPKEPK